MAKRTRTTSRPAKAGSTRKSKTVNGRGGKRPPSRSKK